MLVSAFTADFKQSLSEINIDLNAVKYGKLTVERRIEINKKISETIQFHGEAKELSVPFGMKYFSLEHKLAKSIFLNADLLTTSRI